MTRALDPRALAAARQRLRQPGPRGLALPRMPLLGGALRMPGRQDGRGPDALHPQGAEGHEPGRAGRLRGDPEEHREGAGVKRFPSRSQRDTSKIERRPRVRQHPSRLTAGDLSKEVKPMALRSNARRVRAGQEGHSVNTAGGRA